jgi:hypothetical protein
MVVAGAMQHGGPVIGTPWPTSRRSAWKPPHPLSHERKGKFACLVVRTETDNEFCRSDLGFFLYNKNGRPGEWPPPMHYFATSALCRQVLEPPS